MTALSVQTHLFFVLVAVNSFESPQNQKYRPHALISDLKLHQTDSTQLLKDLVDFLRS